MFDMLGNIIKNLTSKPATRMHPFIKREPFKDSRGKVDIDIDGCIFCGICGRKCPSAAIDVSKADKSWEVNHFSCLVCGECEDVCPKKCIHMSPKYKSSAYDKSNSVFVQIPNSEEASADEKK